MGTTLEKKQVTICTLKHEYDNPFGGFTDPDWAEEASAFCNSLKEKNEKAAKIFEDRWGERDDYFRITDKIGTMKELLLQVMPPEKFADLILTIENYAVDKATESRTNILEFQQETMRLGDMRMLPTYDVPTFCQKYQASLDEKTGKINVKPPFPGLFIESIKKYVDSHREEIIQHIKGE